MISALAILPLFLGQSLASPAFVPTTVALITEFTSTEVTTVVDYLTLPVSYDMDCTPGQPVTVTVTAPPSTVTVTEWAECTLTSGGSSSIIATSLPSMHEVTEQVQSSSFRVPPLFSSKAQSAKITAVVSHSLSSAVLSSTVVATSQAPYIVIPPHHATPSVVTSSSASSTSVAQSALALTTPMETENVNALPTNTIIQNLRPVDPVYTALALYSHNVHRANHTDTGPLSYNATLVHYAQEKASSCIWDETLPADASGVGMNLAEGTYIGAANVTATIEDMWYNSEISLFPGYGLADPDMSDFNDWGHFTQVVWRATMSVGCWSSPCSRKDGAANEIGSGFFTVCMYYPEGNVAGEYADQVTIPRDRATIHGL